MKVNRKEFLSELEAILPGLSIKEEIEQSSFVVFQDGRVHTFNDEISCSIKSCLNITAAVQALPLIKLLRRKSEETLDIKVGDNKLHIKGKSSKTWITLSEDITLDIGAVDKPKKWKRLPKNFIEAMTIAGQCAGKDETRFALTCIHITADYIEATDNHQCCRYAIENRFKKELLIRHEVANHLYNSNITSFSETKSWMHFKNKTGLLLSCRRYLEDFLILDEILFFKGKTIVLPKIGVDEAVECAEIFTYDADSDDKVSVKLSENKLTIESEVKYGGHIELKKVKYAGRDLSFRISPKLLVNIILKKKKGTISNNLIRVHVGNFIYVAALTAEKAKE